MTTTYYTSRSAIETNRDCPRKRLIRYHLDGFGYVGRGHDIALTTGLCIHSGIEYLLKKLKKTGQPISQLDVEYAVSLGVNRYKEILSDGGRLVGRGLETDEAQAYTKAEQTSLIEALIRVWAAREAPKLTAHYKVLEVEVEIAFPLTTLARAYNGMDYLPKAKVDIPRVLLESRIDAVLQHNQTNDISIYSLKSTKAFTWYMEKSYKEDLQGITEIIAYEIVLRHKEKLGTNKLGTTKVSNVQFCFLVKGDRREYKDENAEPMFQTRSPLITGYRRFTPSGVEYAHSLYFPNPKNDSGFGRLGRGWEFFEVWKEAREARKNKGGYNLTIKSWIEKLTSGKIQPECGDVIAQQVVTPIPYNRNAREISETAREIVYQESDVVRKLEDAKGELEKLKTYFPKYRQSCHYPTECEYYWGCYEAPDFLGTPDEELYQIRTPHHVREMEAMKERVG